MGREESSWMEWKGLRGGARIYVEQNTPMLFSGLSWAIEILEILGQPSHVMLRLSESYPRFRSRFDANDEVWLYCLLTKPSLVNSQILVSLSLQLVMQRQNGEHETWKPLYARVREFNPLPKEEKRAKVWANSNRIDDDAWDKCSGLLIRDVVRHEREIKKIPLFFMPSPNLAPLIRSDLSAPWLLTPLV